MRAGLWAILGLLTMAYALVAMAIGSSLSEPVSDGRPMLELGARFYVFHWLVFGGGVCAWCRACRGWLTPSSPAVNAAEPPHVSHRARAERPVHEVGLDSSEPDV